MDNAIIQAPEYTNKIFLLLLKDENARRPNHSTLVRHRLFAALISCVVKTGETVPRIGSIDEEWIQEQLERESMLGMTKLRGSVFNFVGAFSIMLSWALPSPLLLKLCAPTAALLLALTLPAGYGVAWLRRVLMPSIYSHILVHSDSPLVFALASLPVMLLKPLFGVGFPLPLSYISMIGGIARLVSMLLPVTGAIFCNS